ncbi:MAG: hypothetical protein NZU63_12880 [Gemmataceae bacterium]|nr:hypothetical protein [Gemmataceae bacterium]
MVVKLPAPSKPFGLDIQLSDVTDTGLKELAKLQQLTTLDLWGTEVTDAGLKELAKLQQLTTLDLDGTKVTDTGVAELRKALPRCEIIR